MWGTSCHQRVEDDQRRLDRCQWLVYRVEAGVTYGWFGRRSVQRQSLFLKSADFTQGKISGNWCDYQRSVVLALPQAKLRLTWLITIGHDDKSLLTLVDYKMLQPSHESSACRWCHVLPQVCRSRIPNRPRGHGRPRFLPGLGCALESGMSHRDIILPYMLSLLAVTKQPWLLLAGY